jgi:hypothetical protein
VKRVSSIYKYIRCFFSLFGGCGCGCGGGGGRRVLLSFSFLRRYEMFELEGDDEKRPQMGFRYFSLSSILSLPFSFGKVVWHAYIYIYIYICLVYLK